MASYFIKDLGKVITGNTPSKNQVEFYDSNDIRFVKPDIISDSQITKIESTNEFISERARSKARIVGAGTVFVTCIGSIGKIGIAVNGEYAFNQQINAIEPNEKVLPQYLAYCLLYNKDRLMDIANAPVVPIINKTQFENFTINITDDLTEQQKIIDVLNKVSNLIRLREKQLKELNNLINSRFIEMFGSLKRNDKGWPIYCFTDFAEIDMIMIHDFEKYADYPHIGIDSIEKETGNISGYRTVKEDNVISGKYLFTPEHIIYSKIRPNLNKVALPKFIGVCSADAYPILPKKTMCNRIFLAYAMRSEVFLDYILAFSSRTNLPKVNRQQVEGFFCPIPDMVLQEEFDVFTQQIDKSKFVMQQSIDKLQILFDSLMQKYFG